MWLAAYCRSVGIKSNAAVIESVVTVVLELVLFPGGRRKKMYASEVATSNRWFMGVQRLTGNKPILATIS